LKQKWFVIGIILLFVGSGFISTSAQNFEKISPTSRGNWLYVGGTGPGNYSRIQDAINESQDGDTVFVFDDSAPYYESLIINKSITLMGENKETTIIDGTGLTAEAMIKVTAITVTITGFCFQNCQSNITYWTVYIRNSLGEQHHITQNIFRNNNNNALYFIAMYSDISNNTFYNNSAALLLDYGGNHTVEHNVFLNNDESIGLYECHWNTIHGNKIANSSIPLLIFMSHYNNFSENILDGNNHGGLDSIASSKNIFYRNIFSNNQYGMTLTASQGNTIMENNFINNSDYQVISISHPLVGVGLSLYYHRQYVRNGSFFSLLGRNKWEANYWSDWNSSSPRPIDRVIYFWSLRLLTRITGTPYPIRLPQYDWHPAQDPYDIRG
jgi:parallel beta-helix repeat protein